MLRSRRLLAWSVLLSLVCAFVAFPFVVLGFWGGLAMWALIAVVVAGCFAFAWALNEVLS